MAKKINTTAHPIATKASPIVETDAETKARKAKEAKKVEPEVLIKDSQIIDGATNISKAVDTWVKFMAKGMQEGQRIAVSIVLHCFRHHGVDVANNMLAKFPEGLRKQAIQAYFSKYLPATYNEETGAFVYNAKVNSKDGMPASQDFRTKPWYKAAGKEANYKPFTNDYILERMKELANQVRSHVAKPKAGDTVNSDTIKALETAITGIKLVVDNTTLADTATKHAAAA